MKMKKFAFLFSMIAMFCVLTACSDGKEKLDFVYSDDNIISSSIAKADEMQNASYAQRAYWEDQENALADAYLTGVENFDNAAAECGEFIGYRSKVDGSVITMDYNEISQMDEEAFNEWYSGLVRSVDATIKEEGANVTVELIAVYNTRDVIYTFVYERNPMYDYAYEMYQQNVPSFQVKEILATPDYTFGEKMGKAGANTLMGMGTVFAVLIFISIIIGQFEKIGKLSMEISSWWEARKLKKAQRSEEDAVAMDTAGKTNVSRTTSATAQDPMNDSQLVAVITAAVVASSVATGGTDRLIVRSIKKAKR